MRNNEDTPAIYISYAWNPQSEAITDAIEKEFLERGVRIIRDKTNLGYKGRIKGFMEQIGRGNYVIIVISNKYLRSENCMFELLQIFKNDNFYERIFPVVLDEVKIAKASDRVDLVKYWENETESLDTKIRELKDLANLQGVTDDLNLYTEIRNNIARLTNILKDINTLNTNLHINSDFEQLYGLIQEKIVKDRKHRAKSAYDQNQPDGGLDPDKQKPNVLVRISARLFGKRTFFEFFRKNKNGAITFGITAIIGALAFFLVLPQFIGQGYKAEETIVEEPMRPPIAEPEDSTALTDKDTTQSPILRNEKVVEAQPITRYTVELVVPSSMTKAKVFVDGQPAEVVERNLVFIKIRVKEKSSSHHIEITNGTESCFTEYLIRKDDEQLSLCD